MRHKRILSVFIMLTPIIALFASMFMNLAAAEISDSNELLALKCVPSGGSVYFDVEKGANAKGNVFTAIYDESGATVDVRTNETSGCFSGLKEDAFYNVKSFLWRDDLQPECEPLIADVWTEPENYAYVLDADMATGSFGELNPVIRVLYKNSKIAELNLAEEMFIENPPESLGGGESVIYRYKNYSVPDILNLLNDSFKGRVINMLLCEDGYLKRVKLAGAERSGFTLGAFGEYDYNSEDRAVSVMGGDGKDSFEIKDDTRVFLIGGSENNYEFGAAAGEDAYTTCDVVTGAELKPMSSDGAAKKSAAVYTSGLGDNIAKSVIIYNSNEDIIQKDSAAVISAVDAVIVGGEPTLSVSFYESGELISCAAASETVGDLSLSAQPGEVFKLGFKNGKIVSAEKLSGFERPAPKINPGEDFTISGVPDYLTASGGDAIFGAVLEHDGDSLKIAELKNGKPDASAVSEISLNDTDSYYCCIPSEDGTRYEIVPATALDFSLDFASTDNALTNDGLRGNYEIEYGGVSKPAPAWGMLSYVLINKTENGNDIVCYKPYDYEYDASGKSAEREEEYAYVLNAEFALTMRGSVMPELRILDQNGEIKIIGFNNRVSVTNPNRELLDLIGADGSQNKIDFEYKKYNIYDMQDFLDSFIGTAVRLSVVNNGVNSITLPYTGTDEHERETTLSVIAGPDNAFEYNRDNQEFRISLKRIDVNSDTMVFFIGQPGDNFAYGEASYGQPVEDCWVTTASELATMNGNQTAVAYSYNDPDGIANLILLYNSDNATSPENGVSVITNVARGRNGSLRLTYYQDGELKTEETVSNFAAFDLNLNTQPGMLCKFGHKNNVITSVIPYLTFYGEIRSDILSSETNPGVPKIGTIYSGASDEEIMFGAIVRKSGNRIYIAPMNNLDVLPDFNNITGFSLYNRTVNCYVYDAAKSARSRCSIGNPDEIYVDSQLAGDDGVPTGAEVVYNDVDIGAVPIPGMLDYAYMRAYDRTVDLVIYAQRKYDYKIK